jgi:hypothetical protein
MRKYLLIVLAMIATQGVSQQRASFVEEDLTFIISDGQFRVKGIYYFFSEQPTVMMIKYPFPEEETYGEISDIRVTDVKTGLPLPYIARDTNSVNISLQVNGLTPVTIEYAQALRSNNARYILMTTQQWAQPLQKAHFRLVTPLDSPIITFSIAPHDEIIIDQERIYLWNFSNFLPEVDFEIRFKI